MNDLNGTWVGQDETINSRGISLTQKTVILKVDDDGLITGSTSWSLISGPGGHHLDTPATKDAEPVIGAFDPETGTFYLAEMDEPGFWYGTLRQRDEARCFLVQTGPKPVVSSVVLRRQAD